MSVRLFLIFFAVIAYSHLFSDEDTQQNQGINIREIEPDITGDYPEGERVDPEILMLNGKDIRENSFKPGTYELEIEHPGYVSVYESLTIDPGDKPYLLRKVLTTKPRKIHLNIVHDIKGAESLGSYRVTIAPLDKLNEVKEVDSSLGKWYNIVIKSRINR